jgi:hypothetical protein
MTGCFPALWKVSNIVPTPKNGDNVCPSNYRPIYLLPILSKVLENHIVKLLMEFLMVKFLTLNGAFSLDDQLPLNYCL